MYTPNSGSSLVGTMNEQTTHHQHAYSEIPKELLPAPRTVLRHISERPHNPYKPWEPGFLTWGEPWKSLPSDVEALWGPGRQDRELYRQERRKRLWGKLLKDTERRWAKEDSKRRTKHEEFLKKRRAEAEAGGEMINDAGEVIYEGSVPGIYGPGNVGYDSEEEVETWKAH